MDKYDKVQIQLVFPIYIILLVIVIIIVSECSTKFARIIGKGNPIAVLTTMILLSYTKFFNVVIGSVSLLYLKPAYGSRNLNITRFYQFKQIHPESFALDKKHYSMLIFAPIIFLIGILYTSIVFFWPWLLNYQDRFIFRWVKYQKLHHFMEPHHAPYTSKHRYWTGLLLLVRVVLYFVRVLNFSQDPQIDLMATVIVVTCLLLLKGTTSKRVYKHWLIDTLENAIYFNLSIDDHFCRAHMVLPKPRNTSESECNYVHVYYSYLHFVCQSYCISYLASYQALQLPLCSQAFCEAIFYSKLYGREETDIMTLLKSQMDPSQKGQSKQL